MDANEFWRRIKALLKEQGKTVDWLSERLGIAPQTLRNRMSAGKWATMEELYEIANALDIAVEDLVREKPIEAGREDDAFVVPVLDQALSAGHGEFLPEKDEAKEYMAVPLAMQKYGKNVRALRVHGDSMQPTLMDGDTVLIDGNGWDGSEGVYAIQYEGSGFIKRIQMLGGMVRIISDNPRYPVMEVPADSGNVRILGKARYSVKKAD